MVNVAANAIAERTVNAIVYGGKRMRPISRH